MTMDSDLARFLIRTVVDQEFRELALLEPERAFQGFELSIEDREILSSRDHRILDLIGRVIRRAWGREDETRAMTDAPPLESKMQTGVNDAALRMRLVPVAYQTPQGNIQYSFSASLHAWNDDRSTWEVDAESDAEGTSSHGAVDFQIHISATTVSDVQEGVAISYAASIRPAERFAEYEVSKDGSERSWSTDLRYHSNSEAAIEAAARVREADPGQRRERILELIDALRTGEANA